MSIVSVLPYIQIVLSILLIGGVLLQRSEAGLGSAFGESGFGGSIYTRRGVERTLFIATLIVGILFALSALAALVL